MSIFFSFVRSLVDGVRSASVKFSRFRCLERPGATQLRSDENGDFLLPLAFHGSPLPRGAG